MTAVILWHWNTNIAHCHVPKEQNKEAMTKAWDMYRTRKQKAAALVQLQLHIINHKLMEQLRAVVGRHLNVFGGG